MGDKLKPWEYRAVPLRMENEASKLSETDLQVNMPDTSPSSQVLTDLAPTDQLKCRTTIDVCLELLENPPTRNEAVERLVATFRPEIHEAQRERWTNTTLSGRPVGDALEAYLLAEAVGLMAWAQEREERGLYNRGAFAWVSSAWQVVERQAHRLKAA